jgi:LmbE family N-acetylglucosaminyl deacetylase
MIADYLKLVRRSVAMPEIAASFLSVATPRRDPGSSPGQAPLRPCAVLLSPHPDDECLTGALPLRLLREHNWQIVNVAVSLGSDVARRAARKTELAKASAVLGFHGMLADANGFSVVTPKIRDENAQAWRLMAARIGEIIAQLQPQLIMFPHAQDAHPTHIGTHFLGMDALALQDAGFSCAVAQSDYWQPHAEPNLMVGIGEEDASALLSALACHAGENARNPFDARFPAFLIDNVRRGSERVGGKGAVAAPMDFAMIYRLGVWRGGKFIPSALSRIISATDSIGDFIDL